MVYSIALAIFLIFEIFLVILSIVIVYHFRRYSLDERSTKRITNIFITGFALLAVIALVVFFSVPWSELGNILGKSALEFIKFTK